MARTIFNIVALAIITAFAVIGLLTSQPESGKQPARPTAPPQEQTSTPQPKQDGPQRIITLAPSSSEIVFALGAGDRVVGVGSFVTYPPEALTREKVGGWLDADTETILKLRPDLVILQGAHESVRQICQDNDIPILPIIGESLESIYAAIVDIGERIGKRSEAEGLIAEIKLQLQNISEAVKGLERHKVFLSASRSIERPLGQLYTFGKNQFLTELVEIAGGQNVFADVDHDYPQVSLEEVVGRRPSVIIELMPDAKNAAAVTQQAQRQWQVLDTLPAVKDQRVHVLTEDYVLLPGPRVGQVARLLAKKIHPEVQFD